MQIPSPENVISININGYDTCYFETQDSHGKFICIYIPDCAGKDISDICGRFIAGHYITEIDYQKNADGKIFAIKAYY